MAKLLGDPISARSGGVADVTAQLMAALAGLVVMTAPSLVGYGGTAADIDHIIGPLAISVGIIAASQILRAMRWLNLGSGLVLLGSIFATARPATGSVVVALAAATLVGAATVRGTIDVAFGGGWSSLWRKEEGVD